jgi:putative membrane protein
LRSLRMDSTMLNFLSERDLRVRLNDIAGGAVEERIAQNIARNVTNELAKERNWEAAERTLLAWLRTCLSFISFGFGIYKVVQTIAGEGSRQHYATFIVALSFIMLGSFAMLAATVQHVRTIRLLNDQPNPYMPKRPLGVSVSIALILIGLFAFLAVVVEFFLAG